MFEKVEISTAKRNMLKYKMMSSNNKGLNYNNLSSY